MRKLREIRRNSGLSQKELAGRLGVSRSAVAMWEVGSSSPDVEMLEKISAELNVSVDRLLGIVDVPEDFIRVANLDAVNKEAIKPVRVVGSIMAGYGGIACDDADGIEYDNIKETERYVYVNIEDNDMSPEIKKGDFALVELGAPVKTGDFVAVVCNNMKAIVRKITVSDSGITLSSVRDDVSDITYPSMDMIYMVGKVIEVKRRFNI